MAVVVSFNGGQKTIRTINALSGQVGHIHVVDNGSSSDSVAILKDISRHPKISVSWLSVNKGIGHALNIGIHIARKYNYHWLLTMDQDSVVGQSMIQAFSDAVDKNTSIDSLTPEYSAGWSKVSKGTRLVDYAITSGNLTRMDVYRKIGLYDEKLFIDGVDFDFSLRVRRSNFNIFMVGEAHMQHELGDKACNIPIIGRVHTFHSPLRRYYMYRNYFYLVNKYASEFPKFALKFTASHVVYLLTIILLGKQRLQSIRYIVHGFIDYLRDIKGPYQS